MCPRHASWRQRPLSTNLHAREGCSPELDLGRLSFAYQTRNADGNPSYTNWAWQVVGAVDGADVTVT